MTNAGILSRVQLKQATKDIYGGDEYMTKLIETTVNIDAKDE